MGIRARRRSRARGGGGRGGGGGAGSAAPTAARTEQVTRLWAGARVEGGGAAGIVEVLDYDFGGRRRHGIFRDVPGLDPVDPVEVSSPSAPAQVEATGTAQQARLRIGDPARTVGGRHRYRIAYRLAGVAPDGRLAWNAVGTSWPVPIAGAEVHVVAPHRFEGARCVQGAAGSDAPCTVAQPEPGHLAAAVDGLAAGEGVTVYATAGSRLAAAPALPDPPAGLPPDPGTGPLPPALVAAGAALAGAETRVDSAELATLATVEFLPPRELTPAQGGVLLAEAVRPEHKVAWLIGAAADGHLDLEDEGGRVTLVRLPRRDGAATYLLDAAFEGRERLTLGRYDEGFAGAWRSLGRELAAWERSCGLWDPAGDRRRALARTLGVVAGIAGLLVAVQLAVQAGRSGAGWLVGVAAGALLAGSGAAVALRAWELRVRTPAGSGLWLRTESFRRFLAASEAHHAEEAARLGHLREYTAWAVAVGELDRWSRAVAASAAAGADPAVRYPALAPALVAGTSASSAPPSSGGSGGGGGGGVGGGAGGGGGGSW